MEDDSLPVDATQAVPVVTPKVTWTPAPATPVVAPAAAPAVAPSAPPVVPSHAAAPIPTVIESKVLASTGVAFAASVAVAVLNGMAANSQLLGGLPPAVQALILALVPPLLTFVAGYQTSSNRVPS